MTRLAFPIAVLSSALAACVLAACADGSGGSAGLGDDERDTDHAPNASGAECDEPAEGCACAGNQAPVSCSPSDDERGAPLADGLCFEGTRRCIGGVFGPCEDVRSYAAPDVSASALVNQTADHPPCEECSRRCFVVRDELSPDDGPLSSTYADNVVFHGSGGGITLEQDVPTTMPPPVVGLPIGSLLGLAPVGRSATATHTHEYVASLADIYLLGDMSPSMTEATQWMNDRFTAGTFLDSRTRCAGGDQTLLDQGISGAARCMIEDVWFGGGLYGDIPFTAYGGNAALMEPQRSIQARTVIPFQHTATMSSGTYATQTMCHYAFTGDPDRASSHVPALYTLATGEGLYAGFDRYAVPASECAAWGGGQPCFREDTPRIVVMLSGSPMHNGPDPASYPYEYDSSQLEILTGTGPGAELVPPTNESWDSAYHVTDDAANELAVVVGDSDLLEADLPGDYVGCGADDDAKDGVFTFDVVTSSGNADVTLSLANTTFPAVLSVFSDPPSMPENLPSAGDTNELFTSAHDLGDLTGRSIVIPGDTTSAASMTDMGADYQGALVAPACSASTLSPDAVYAFDVDSASGPVNLELTADMGGNRAVLAVFEDDDVPRWPAVASPLTATGNSGSSPGNVFTIPSGAGNEYVSVRGDTRSLAADFNAADLGGTLCSPDNTAKDAAFHIRVDGTRTLRFDTEGSSFDTVLSLHDRMPLTNAGAMLRFPSEDTHRDENEDAASAHNIGQVNGRQQVFEGSTSGMRADVNDTFGCGTQSTCGDAVYRMQVRERTALRIDATGTGYEPGVVVTRVDPASVSGNHVPIAAGGRHTCAISAGKVFCWGADDQGQLGNGGAAGDADSPAAVEVSGVSDAQSICAGTQHACASTLGGDVYCWGAGGQGRLGNGSDATQFTPVLASDIGASRPLGPAAQVTCGDAFSCALLRDGRVACFGANSTGQIGDTTTTERRSPTLVATTERFEQIEAGDAHACGIRTNDNAVFCWGEGSYGKLGDGATTHNLVPARAGSMLVGASYVMAGGQHTCASLSSGRVYCWGRNNVGQLGRGATGTGNQTTPIVVRNADGSADLANVRGGMAAGEDHTCVTTLEGFVMCWGGNGNREIGHNNSAANVTRPVGTTGLLDAVHVASNRDHTCAVRANSQLVCWGANADAQIGDGTTTGPAIPVRSQASGSQPVAFGDGTVDAAFTQACRSGGQPPEQGCELRKRGDESYFFCDNTTNARTWSGAAQACEAVGMQLAVVDEAGENAFIAGQLESGEQAWLGVKRESDDSWLNLSEEPHFEDINGQRVFYHEGSSWLTGVVGTFTDAAAPDLVDSKPRRTSSSTWASGEPSGGDGENCVTIDSAGKWRAEPCSAIPPRDCGLFGLGCLFGFLGDLVGGILDWIVPWVGDITRVVFDSLAGRYASPQFSGGVDHAYVCEEVATSSDITLDPGEYFITVKGIDDGITGNPCEGPYELSVTDLGSPTGGFITCDDSSVPETNSSVIERTLSTGDYYVILKGKRPTDEGEYRLTVRDVTAVPSTTLACDQGLGATDPATVTLAAQPGRRYYAVVKGDGAGDKGAFDLSIEDTTVFGTTQVACDSGSGPTGSPELNLSLPAGTYYAVLKGQAAWHSGNYQLSIGGADPATGTFVPPTYDEAVQALNDHDIRVGTVISCDTSLSSCADARDQAQLLADDTDGTVQVAASAADVPLQIVRVIEQLTAADRIAGSLVFAPDANPGFTPYSVEAVPDPGNHCTMGPDGQSFVDCTPGATPAFLVSLHNPLLTPVAAATNALGLYQFTLRVTTEREGEPMRTDDVPIFIQPSGAPEPGSFSKGTYFQEFTASGCETLNAQAEDAGTALFRPSWDELRFDVDVQPDTSLSFFACGAASEAELARCDDAASNHRVVTVSAGTGSGTACTVATQDRDCPTGYCSPYLNVCQFLEGASCRDDGDCPGVDPGRCQSGPSSATIGRTCQVEDLIAEPASALGTDNLPYLRMSIELESGGDGSRTPSVFWWEARYNCNLSE